VAPMLNDIPIEFLDSDGNPKTLLEEGDQPIDISLKDGKFLGKSIVVPEDGGTQLTPNSPDSGSDGGLCSVSGPIGTNRSKYGGFIGLVLVGGAVAYRYMRRKEEESE